MPMMPLHAQDGVKKIPKMFNVMNPPTVMVDACDSQLPVTPGQPQAGLHNLIDSESEENRLLSESLAQLVAFGA
jgi:hypothetical protein